MVKSDLIQKLCNLHVNIRRSDITKIVDIFFEEIENCLMEGAVCELRYFGTFKVKNRKARLGRNPKTGEKVLVKEKRVPFFKMSKQLMSKINSSNIEKKL